MLDDDIETIEKIHGLDDESSAAGAAWSRIKTVLGSPKLPTLEEVRTAPGVGTGTKYVECYVDRVVKNAYNFICRQLSASINSASAEICSNCICDYCEEESDDPCDGGCDLTCDVRGAKVAFVGRKLRT